MDFSLNFKMERRIYVFGNPLIGEDSVAIEVAKELKDLEDFEFKVIESLDEVAEEDLQDLWIMDSAKGINEIKLIDDLRELETNPVLSGHDFDLALQLKLWKKIHKLKKVKIIGLPSEENVEKLAKILKNLIYKFQNP